MKQSHLTGNLLLLLAALVWGCSFVAQSVGMDHVGPFTFQATRSLLGAASLAPIMLLQNARTRRQGKDPRLSPQARNTLLLGGLLCGLVLTVAVNLQQMAMRETGAGKAGFLTTLYILFVPIAGMLLGKRPPLLLWVCIVIAGAGLYLLSVQEGFVIAPSDLMLIACAVVFTVHIMLVDHFSPQVPGVWLSCLQFLVVGVISAVPALLFERPQPASLLRAWAPLLYAGVMSSGVGYTLQILGQRRTLPTVAALLMSLEAVFALLAGMLLLGERLTTREALGCALMFLAILLSQWAQAPRRARKTTPSLVPRSRRNALRRLTKMRCET